MYTEIDDFLIKQFIDAEQVRSALLSAERRAFNYRGSMYWKKAKDRDYLCREYSSRQVKSLGVRSAETENIISEFRNGKSVADENFKELAVAYQRHARINAALKLGRVPNIVIDLLEEIRKSGLQDHFLVIGTNSLFAYETMAGVRFNGDITATADVDLLWDSRRRLTLVADGGPEFQRQGLIGLARKVDPTFELVIDQGYRATNAKGYMIDLIKRRPLLLMDDVEHPQLVKNEDDFWAAKIKNMDWLLSSPKFKQVVVGVGGRMAEMITVDPRAFVFYKAYLSQLDDRDPIKKPRDLALAKALYALIQDKLPLLAFDRICSLPARLQNLEVIDLLEGKTPKDQSVLISHKPGDFFSGKVIDISDGIVTQKIGRTIDDIVQHSNSKLKGNFREGQVVDIRYGSDGFGVASVLSQKIES